MAWPSVVVVQVSVLAVLALAVGCPGPGVGPFGQQGAVEAFGFVVGSGAVGFDVSAFECPQAAHTQPQLVPRRSTRALSVSTCPARALRGRRTSAGRGAGSPRR